MNVQILVIDGRTDNPEFLETACEGLQIDLVRVQSADEALHSLPVLDPSLIIVDEAAPGIDAHGVARELREAETCYGVPVIFLGDTDPGPEHSFASTGPGMVDYLVKPVDPRLLRNRLEMCSELQFLRRKYQEKSVLLADRSRELALAWQDINAHIRSAEEESKAKGAFIANVSYTLRTMLTTQLLLSENLLEREREAGNRENISYAVNILQAGYNMRELLDRILEFSESDPARSILEPESFSVRSLLDTLRDRYGAQAESAGLDLEFDVDERVPKLIEADAGRIEQALDNLVSNALKFTREGGVRVRAYLTDEMPDCQEAVRAYRDLIAFAVSDTGVGIEPRQMARIFQPRMQAEPDMPLAANDGDRRESSPGGALGLAMTRNVAKTLGGDIGVRSRPGEGSTFTLYTPYAASHAVEAVETEKTESAAGDGQNIQLTGRTVLLAEDNAANVFAISQILKAAGMQFVEVRNGKAALEALAARGADIDIVLTDIKMPEMDGYELIRAIRQSPDHRHLPIVALTALALRGDEKRCLAAGANAYVTKPIESQSLLGRMRSCLANAQPAAVASGS